MGSLELTGFPEGVERPKAVTFELSEEKVKTFEVGQEVVVSLKGVVKELSVRLEGADENNPATLRVRITEQQIRGLNVFSELADESDEED